VASFGIVFADDLWKRTAKPYVHAGTEGHKESVRGVNLFIGRFFPVIQPVPNPAD
jgi:hypothetical protein